MISSPLVLLGAYETLFNVHELSEEEKHRRDRRIPRIALRKYEFSSFRYMFESKNDQALLNCCAVDHVTFKELLELCEPYFSRYTVNPTNGRIRKIKLDLLQLQVQVTPWVPSKWP